MVVLYKSFMAIISGSAQTTQRLSSVRPVMDSLVEEQSKEYQDHAPPVTPIDEAEQFDIYNVVKRWSLEARSTDPLIALAVRAWKRSKTPVSEGAIKLSDACGYGLVCPAVCSKVLRDIVGWDKIIISHHEEKIRTRLSALYFEMCRQHEIRRAYRDMLYGPEGSIEAYKRQLGL